MIAGVIRYRNPYFDMNKIFIVTASLLIPCIPVFPVDRHVRWR